MNEVKTKR